MCVFHLAESLDSVAELPTAVGQQLQHLVKGRPRRAKTRAPSRPMLRPTEIIENIQDLGEGLDTFFRPGSVTPTGTPLVSPTSDDRYRSVLPILFLSVLPAKFCDSTSAYSLLLPLLLSSLLSIILPFDAI
jgi:hypothetical protein